MVPLLLAGPIPESCIGGFLFYPMAIKLWVSQGSVLSPMLFNNNMKPLGEVIRGLGDISMLMILSSTSPCLRSQLGQ